MRIGRIKNLPERLFAAFDWTDAAGEIDDLRTGGGKALEKYIKESAANAAKHGVQDVTEETLTALYLWLTRGKGK